MLEWQSFDAVFRVKPDYTLDHKQVDAINRHRKELGGTLFFDRVCQGVGLKHASKAYPPKTNDDLKVLWQKVVECSAAEQQKQALLFYILKDCRQISNADINFANQVYLPRRYELVMTGLWELDHCQWSRALEHLSDPFVTPTFPDEVLLAMIRHPKCDDSLAMAYYMTVRPPLQDKEALDAYFDILCNTSIVEAYRCSQKQPEAKNKSLLEHLIYSVHSGAADNARAERALLLISLPFTAEEEEWFEECLLHGLASKCLGARDSVLTRRIAIGKCDQNNLDCHSGAKVNGLTWTDVLSSLRRTSVS